MTDAQAQELLTAISALFPDDAPHKHPETGVSLLDDVRDVIEDGRRWRYRESDVRYELNKHKQYLETASHQINHLRGINEYLLKAITEPIKTQISPMYIMSPNHLNCIFCTFNGTLDELKHHSARCPEHPAVKELAEKYKR